LPFLLLSDGWCVKVWQIYCWLTARVTYKSGFAPLASQGGLFRLTAEVLKVKSTVLLRKIR